MPDKEGPATPSSTSPYSPRLMTTQLVVGHGVLARLQRIDNRWAPEVRSRGESTIRRHPSPARGTSGAPGRWRPSGCGRINHPPPPASPCPHMPTTISTHRHASAAVCKCHAALAARFDLVHLILDVPERVELALVNHLVTPQDPNVGRGPHHAVNHLATSHLADGADLEGLQHVGRAGERAERLVGRRPDVGGHERADVVEQIVHDRVLLDLDVALLSRLARRSGGHGIEAEDQGVRDRRKHHVLGRDGAGARAQHPRLDAEQVVGHLELLQAGAERLCRALHVRLDHQVNHLDRQLGGRARQEGVAVGGRPRCEEPRRPRVPLELLPHLGDLARLGLVGCDDEGVAGSGQPAQADELYGNRRAGLLDRLAARVLQSADATPLRAGNHNVAQPERALLDERGGYDALAELLPRLHHNSLCHPVGVGLEV
eukprot:scaffold331_cov101-Isochrysis_galbana.AAC.1